MASGLPLLVSDRCGCAPDLVVNGRNGFTFNPLHEQALTHLMLQFSDGEMDLENMGQASREIVARFSPQTFAVNLQSAAAVAWQSPSRPGGLLNQVVLQALIKR